MFSSYFLPYLTPYIDEDDKQQVLVRATGRVVSADQCGVSLEKRFAFYDQIHTTGMDIKHVVNAVAVITLGKDMVSLLILVFNILWLLLIHTYTCC